MQTSRHARAAALTVLTMAATAACGGRQQVGPGPAVAPTLVVERFLQAVNANDIETMARLFGTREGTILERDPRAQVEQRMYLLASVLRHRDYAIERERVIPGRIGDAVTLDVRLRTNRYDGIVPFVVVRTKHGWLVEQVDVEKLTSAG